MFVQKEYPKLLEWLFFLFLEDNVVCYLDEGMMWFYDDEFKRNLSEAILLLVDQDVDGLMNQLMYMDILDYDVDTRTLKRELNDLFGRYFGVSLNRFDGILNELLGLMQDYGVILPNELVTMARGLTLIESVAHNLDPEIDVLASVKVLLQKLPRKKSTLKIILKARKAT